MYTIYWQTIALHVTLPLCQLAEELFVFSKKISKAQYSQYVLFNFEYVRPRLRMRR